MKARSLVPCILLSISVILILSTVSQATEYTNITAENISRQIENGKEVNYTDCRIVGELDVSKIKLKTVPNPYFYKLSEGYGKERLISYGFLENSSVIESNITIKNSIFENRLNFSNVLFKNSADFSGTNFSDSANFKGSNFSDSANFSGTNFNGPASFMWTNFYDSADFSGTNFNDLTDFIWANFNDSADFSGTNFNSLIYFEYANFNGSTYFSGRTFKDVNISTNFSGKTINYVNISADFMWTNFYDSANFSGMNFNGSTYFSGTNFYGPTFFNKTNFYDYTDLSNTNFNGPTYFSGTNFYGPIYFSRTNFNGLTFFNKMNFNGSASFFNTNFYNYTDFSDTNFYNYTNFSDTNFNGPTYFFGTNFNGSAFFDKTNFNFFGSFFGTNFNAGFKGANKSENIFTDGKNCELFREYYKTEGRYIDADNIYYNYRQCTQDNKSLTSFSKLMDFLSWITCGYGLRLSHTLYCGLFIIMVFTYIYGKHLGLSLFRSKNIKNKNRLSIFYWKDPGIYRLSDAAEKKSIVSFWDALYFSVSIFTTVGSEGWYPKDNFRKWVTLEGLLGWIMLGIFMATLTNVLIR